MGKKLIEKKKIKIFRKISGSVFSFGVPEPTNPNRTEPVRFRNEKKKIKPQAASSLPLAIMH
jgi:hypothetical protein